jgi:hypothetical protein
MASRETQSVAKPNPVATKVNRMSEERVAGFIESSQPTALQQGCNTVFIFILHHHLHPVQMRVMKMTMMMKTMKRCA